MFFTRKSSVQLYTAPGALTRQFAFCWQNLYPWSFFPFIAIKLLLSSKNSGCGKWYSCIVLRIVGIPHRPDWKNWTANHINVWDIPGLHSLSVGVSHLSFWINSNFSSNSFVVILVLPIFLYRITIFCVRNSNFISRTQKGTQIIRVPFWVPSYEYHPALNAHTD